MHIYNCILIIAMCALIHRTASDEYKQEAKDQDEEGNLEQLLVFPPHHHPTKY